MTKNATQITKLRVLKKNKEVSKYRNHAKKYFAAPARITAVFISDKKLGINCIEFIANLSSISVFYMIRCNTYPISQYLLEIYLHYFS